jgi:hypothetical protein
MKLAFLLLLLVAGAHGWGTSLRDWNASFTPAEERVIAGLYTIWGAEAELWRAEVDALLASTAESNAVFDTTHRAIEDEMRALVDETIAFANRQEAWNAEVDLVFGGLAGRTIDPRVCYEVDSRLSLLPDAEIAAVDRYMLAGATSSMQITFYCNVDAFYALDPVPMTIKDAAGPAGCEATATKPTNSCVCWFEADGRVYTSVSEISAFVTAATSATGGLGVQSERYGTLQEQPEQPITLATYCLLCLLCVSMGFIASSIVHVFYRAMQ